MRIQQITPNYGQNEANPNFKAGKIRITNPERFFPEDLEAIAKNDEFKKLAKIAGEKGGDLVINEGPGFSINLHFNDILFPIECKYGSIVLSESIESFRVDDMMRKLENERIKRENKEKIRNKALKLINDFNEGSNVPETVNAKKSFWQKLKDLF